MLAGCSSIRDGFSKEEVLEGERSLLVKDTDSEQSAGIGGVSISAMRLNADWSQPGGALSNAPGNLSYSGSLSRIWSTSVGSVKPKRSRTASSPIVHQGAVYILDTKGIISATSLSTGGKLWNANIAPIGEKSSVTGGGLAASGGILFASTAYGELVALDASSGNVVWTRALGESARSAPTAGEGLVVVTTASNKVLAYKTANGAEAWEFRGIPEKAGLIHAGSPAISSGTVIVPFSSGEIIALEASSGNLRWSDTLVRSGKRFALSGFSDISGNPVVNSGVVYAGSISGRFVADSIGGGSRLWTKNYTSVDSPALSGNTLFITDNTGLLLAVSRETGEIRWSTKLPMESREKWGGPLLAGGVVWVGSNKGRFVGVKAETGAIELTTSLGSPVLVPPIVASGTLLILTQNGRLTAYK